MAEISPDSIAARALELSLVQGTRLEAHERACVERLAVLHEDIDGIHRLLWAAIGFLVMILVTIVGYYITTVGVPHKNETNITIAPTTTIPASPIPSK